MAEKRHFRRHSVRDDDFEIFGYKSSIIGKLINISKGGLACQYTPIGSEKAEFKKIDIMAKRPSRFFLAGIACRVVYDIGTLAEDQTFTGGESRLCGLKFIRLTRDQDRKLDLLIAGYSPDPADVEDPE